MLPRCPKHGCKCLHLAACSHVIHSDLLMRIEDTMVDPIQSKSEMIIRSTTPYNAEPPLGRLCAFLTTAQKDFYVRCHGNIPVLDEVGHTLRVGGRVRTPLHINMAELRAQFPKRTVTAVMQCAGNRRADMQSVRSTLGDPWEPWGDRQCRMDRGSAGGCAASGRRGDGPIIPRCLRRLRRGGNAEHRPVYLWRFDPDNQGDVA